MRGRQEKFGSRDVLQLTVFSLVVVLGPLLLYPRDFGLSFEIGLGALVILETLYYSVVLTFLNSGSGLMATLLGAGISLAYRFFLALLFGVMVYAPGGVTFQTAFFEGLHGYWPAFCVFALSSPFVMLSLVKHVIDSLDDAEETPVGARTSPAQQRAQSAPDEAANSSAAPYFPHTQEGQAEATSSDPADFAFGADSNREALGGGSGFERAVAYLGMNGAVRVAAVVDFDGLEVAAISRAGFVSQEWSPFALPMFDNNSEIFSHYGKDVPQKVELFYDDLRIECRLIGAFFLLVVAERQDDELLGVRVNQASEIIEKYISERYSQELFVNMEGNDVRSPE